MSAEEADKIYKRIVDTINRHNKTNEIDCFALSRDVFYILFNFDYLIFEENRLLISEFRNIKIYHAHYLEDSQVELNNSTSSVVDILSDEEFDIKSIIE